MVGFMTFTASDPNNLETPPYICVLIRDAVLPDMFRRFTATRLHYVSADSYTFLSTEELIKRTREQESNHVRDDKVNKRHISKGECYSVCRAVLVSAIDRIDR
jgi:hypothetical protein